MSKKKLSKEAQRVLDILSEKGICPHCKKRFGESKCLYTKTWKRSLPSRWKEVIKILEKYHEKNE